MEHFDNYVALPQELKNKFEIYENTLRKWNNRINLVSKTTLSEFQNRHIKDSLQLFPYLRGTKILDTGSGAGFPGLVLAIAAQSKEFLNRYKLPHIEVTCLDSDFRKILFLNEISRLTDADADLICDRIENLKQNFDTVTARGFASLKILLTMTSKLSKYFVFLKGEKLAKEIEEAEKFFEFNYQIYSSNTDLRGKIITIENVQLK